MDETLSIQTSTDTDTGVYSPSFHVDSNFSKYEEFAQVLKYKSYDLWFRIVNMALI